MKGILITLSNWSVIIFGLYIYINIAMLVGAAILVIVNSAIGGVFPLIIPISLIGLIILTIIVWIPIYRYIRAWLDMDKQIKS